MEEKLLKTLFKLLLEEVFDDFDDYGGDKVVKYNFMEEAILRYAFKLGYVELDKKTMNYILNQKGKDLIRE